MTQNAPLLTPSEVGEMFGTSADAVRRWARDGKIPVITLPSGRLRFRQTDVLALLGEEPTAAVSA